MIGRASVSRRDPVTAMLAVSCIAALIPALLSPAGAATGAPTDSVSSLRWSVVYRGRLMLERSSVPFSWNDEATSSHLNDRFALMGLFRPIRSVEIFLKGATGLRLEETEHYENCFSLEQGHVGAGPFGGELTGTLFLRERRFRSDHRLMYAVSNDASFLAGRGEGVIIEAGRDGRYGLTWTESVLKREQVYSKHGGLPVFHGGGDAFRALRCGIASQRLGVRLGGVVSEVRSITVGDGVMVGADVGINVRGIVLNAELLSTRRGRLRDLKAGRLFGVHTGRLSPDSFSEIFTGEAVFAAEVSGLMLHSNDLGTFRLIPGYRYCGDRIFIPQGEIPGGNIETYIESWWKHPLYDVLVTMKAADGYRAGGVGRRLLNGSLKTRFRGGFEISEGVILADGDGPSVFVSVLDERNVSRISVSALFDGADERDGFSFLADGSMNLGGNLTVRSVLYLYHSRTSLYSIGIGFRPQRRVLFNAAFGSLDPLAVPVSLEHEYDMESPVKDRFVSLSGRVHFGSE